MNKFKEVWKAIGQVKFTYSGDGQAVGGNRADCTWDADNGSGVQIEIPASEYASFPAQGMPGFTATDLEDAKNKAKRIVEGKGFKVLSVKGY